MLKTSALSLAYKGRHALGAAPGDKCADGQEPLDMFLKQPQEVIVSVGAMS